MVGTALVAMWHLKHSANFYGGLFWRDFRVHQIRLQDPCHQLIERTQSPQDKCQQFFMQSALI